MKFSASNCHRIANPAERESFNSIDTFRKTGIETLRYQIGDKIKLVNFNEDSNIVVEEKIITNIEDKNEVNNMYNLVLEDGDTYIVDGIIVSTENWSCLIFP